VDASDGHGRANIHSAAAVVVDELRAAILLQSAQRRERLRQRRSPPNMASADDRAEAFRQLTAEGSSRRAAPW